MAERQVIAVWFSCGAASAVAAKLTLERYGATHDVRVINNPIANEDPDNRRFLADVGRWLGIEIELATHSKYPACDVEEVWEREKYISGVEGAPCTKYLKKGARQQWEARNHHDYLVMGFTADEHKRHDDFVLTERSNVLPVLIDAGLTKADCFTVLARAGIALPLMYILGYPNANCPGCGKATSPTYWNHVRKVHPDVFASRAMQSRKLGARLARYKGKRVFLDELPPDAKGRPMKSLKMPDCGIFCEEKTHG
ncbi:hypothetical protein NG831_06315 [Xanthomonas sacchari]|uniref:hypothetical protein n=1 Tax=Xanthomonas sacchari TaxID=56458 RepID=UPI00224C9DC7|nr:hypothetical protein [Xanthomonas sacchari]MCW0413522.1 hypothetical protein [Xanthomonas sacchari]UYK67773.1 hypothetical protein NG831_06315 [Xanthomonas sacchari]